MLPLLIRSYFLVIYEGISTELFRIFSDPVIGGVSKGYRRGIEDVSKRYTAKYRRNEEEMVFVLSRCIILRKRL
jgi:hypothetical protein